MQVENEKNTLFSSFNLSYIDFSKNSLLNHPKLGRYCYFRIA